MSKAAGVNKGTTLYSRNTGLPYKVSEVSGDKVMVRDLETGQLVNHWFDNEAFSTTSYHEKRPNLRIV